MQNFSQHASASERSSWHSCSVTSLMLKLNGSHAIVFKDCLIEEEVSFISASPSNKDLLNRLSNLLATHVT